MEEVSAEVLGVVEKEVVVEVFVEVSELQVVEVVEVVEVALLPWIVGLFQRCKRHTAHCTRHTSRITSQHCIAG